MKRPIQALLVTLALSGHAQSIRFGPSVGTYIPRHTASHYNKIKTAYIITINDPGDGERTMGGFFGYDINNWLSGRTEVIYFPVFTEFIIFDEAQMCRFCPIKWVESPDRNTIEITSLLELNIPNFKKVNVKLVAGVSEHFQFRKLLPDYYDPTNPLVSLVSNELDDAPKAVVFYGTYGLAAGYRRFILTARYQSMLQRSLFNDLTIDGVDYKLGVKVRYFTVTLNYSFYGFRRKRKARSMR